MMGFNIGASHCKPTSMEHEAGSLVSVLVRSSSMPRVVRKGVVPGEGIGTLLSSQSLVSVRAMEVSCHMCDGVLHRLQGSVMVMVMVMTVQICCSYLKLLVSC